MLFPPQAAPWGADAITPFREVVPAPTAFLAGQQIVSCN
jgi:hypothetical protein